MAEDFEVGGPLPEDTTNRTFIIAVAVIGGLLVLSMICLGGYALFLGPRQQEQRVAEATDIFLTNVAGQTQTAQPVVATDTPVPTSTPTSSPSPTPTQVVAVSTETPGTPLATVDPGTATAIAQATAAAAQPTSTPPPGATATQTRTPIPRPSPTPTSLPVAGFADEAGIPGLAILGAVLVAVMLAARRLRGGSP